MKHYLLFALAMLSFTACSTTEDSLEQETSIEKISVLGVLDSGCLDKNPSRTSTYGESFIYDVEEKDGVCTMHVKHENAMFNCAADKVNVEVHEGEDGSIHIHEIGNSMDANCMCEHNLSFDIQNLKSGYHHVVIFYNSVNINESQECAIHQCAIQVAKDAKGAIRLE